MKEVRAACILDIPTVTEGRPPIAAAMGANADPILLTPADGNPEQLTIHHIRDRGTCIERVNLPDPHLLYPDVQPLGAEWLLVGARAGDGQNARVFDRTGNLLRSFHAGDAIENVQVSKSGEIWISYFDEGIFGEDEPTTEGLVCFNPLGQPVFRYQHLANLHGLPGIMDCDAMNVCSNDDTWLFYYDAFPLVRIRNRQLKDVISDIPPAAHYSTGIAVHEDTFLFG